MELSDASSVVDESTERTKSSSSVVPEENRLTSIDAQETCLPATFQIGEAEVGRDLGAGSIGIQPELIISKSNNDLNYPSSIRVGDGRTGDSIQLFQDGSYNGSLFYT